MLCHCRCTVFLTFINHSLIYMHNSPINEFSFNRYGPSGSRHSSNPNSSLSVTLNFLIMVRFTLIVSGYLIQKSSRVAHLIVTINLLPSSLCTFLSLPCVFMKCHKSHWSCFTKISLLLSFSYIFSSFSSKYPPGDFSTYGNPSFLCLM